MSEPAEPNSAEVNGSESITVVGDGIEVETFNDESFGKLRAHLGIPNDFLHGKFTKKDFKPGGGKGGFLMAFSPCRRYIVKELSPGDHESLLKAGKDFVSHVLSGPTLLCLHVLHYREKATGKLYHVMCNSICKEPHYDYQYTYDLKGCADDKMMICEGSKVHTVHKRIWHAHMWGGECMWSSKRKEYFRCKKDARNWSIKSPPDIHVMMKSALERDCYKFLIPHQFMDYSLVLGTAIIDHPGEEILKKIQSNIPIHCKNWQSPWIWEIPDNQIISTPDNYQNTTPAKGAAKGGGPHIKTTKCQLIACGVIDFLQGWVFAKKVAMCIKVFERNKATIPPKEYGVRFSTKFANAFIIDQNLGNGTRNDGTRNDGTRNDGKDKEILVPPSIVIVPPPEESKSKLEKLSPPEESEETSSPCPAPAAMPPPEEREATTKAEARKADSTSSPVVIGAATTEPPAAAATSAMTIEGVDVGDVTIETSVDFGTFQSIPMDQCGLEHS